MLIRKIKYRFKTIFKSKYDKSMFCNYLHFYNILFHNRIKDLKQMKKILIKIVEKSYNKTIKTNRPAMFIYNKERHDVELYWNEYFMRNVLELRNIWDEPRDLCKKYKKENKKYKQWDNTIESFNNTTKSYLTMDFKDYCMYTIRILDVKIDIYYNMNKNKLYTKKRKIKEDVYDTLKNKSRRHK